MQHPSSLKASTKDLLYEAFSKLFQPHPSAPKASHGWDRSYQAGHDPRKTFVTMCKDKDVDEYAIKRIVRHKIEDITESVYTERTVDWLLEEVKKIEDW